MLKTQIREGLLREQLMATLSGFFGALATILAMVGLYGVISYMVVRRRNEIGVRMALGANRNNILVMVLKEAATLLVLGLVIGAGLALAAGTAAASMLYGLKPTDPFTLGAAITGMIVVAIDRQLVAGAARICSASHGGPARRVTLIRNKPFVLYQGTTLVAP